MARPETAGLLVRNPCMESLKTIDFKGEKKELQKLISNSFLYGSPSWARTSDKRINSPLLYQLSYRGITARTGVLIGRRYATDLARIGQYQLAMTAAKIDDYSIICLILASACSRLSISVAYDSRK